MEYIVPISISLVFLVFLGVFVWLTLNLRKVHLQVGTYNSKTAAVKEEVDQVFSEDFREELRNRGRLHFEKIINENAMFMQQDLHLTASQLNEYMRDSLKKVLDEEFTKYQESIEDAKVAALESITKTQNVMETQRTVLQEELEKQMKDEKQRMIRKLDEHMAGVVNHYLLEALSQEIDMASQSDYIFQHLEEQKAAIIEDVRSGW